jgi:aminoglycoside/choline kinase family phosphotransferase
VFYRDGSTAIVMVQPHPGRNEEASFLDVHGFLERLGLPAPRVFRHIPEQGLVVLEDLGDLLLERVAQAADFPRIVELYEEAVDILVRMRERTAGMTRGCAAFSLAFDEAKLMEELNFFMTHFVRGLCGLEPPPAAVRTLQDFFHRIARFLAAEPRVFTHRDYHSRNLLLHRETLVMIDFQDARMGPPQYDLASLLRDSYVSLPEDLVERLITRYFDATGPQADSFGRFVYVFDVMSLQRNIKALGTFGYQSSVRTSTRYMSSVPRTAAYVAKNVARYEEFAPFHSVAEEYVWGPGLAMGPA